MYFFFGGGGRPLQASEASAGGKVKSTHTKIIWKRGRKTSASEGESHIIGSSLKAKTLAIFRSHYQIASFHHEREARKNNLHPNNNTHTKGRREETAKQSRGGSLQQEKVQGGGGAVFFSYLRHNMRYSNSCRQKSVGLCRGYGTK